MISTPKRGEIYFISIPDDTTTAHEIKYSRPGVIISCDDLNATLSTVNVVFLSTAAVRRSDIPANRHPAIYARKPSVAICEQITTVDQSRLGDFIGRVTDGELAGIEAAILHCLGLSLSLSLS